VTDTVALLSGGLDSAVLLAHEAQHARVIPLYVRVGLAWENPERQMLDHLLAAPRFNGRIAPLETLDFNMRDVYAPSHWAVRGEPPAYDTSDEDVYLAGRNIVLLTKAAIVATSRGLERIAVGLLAGNPFPDATPAFFDAMARALTLGLDRPLEIAAPLVSMRKEDVIRLGRALDVPLHLTLSCMNPLEGPIPLHCGLCSKCRERRDGFRAAGVDDPTVYANASPR
jgi:7-cyano-7-deazaguanine synthase